MNVEVFDDWKSIFHFFIGIASYYFPFLFLIFIFYELIEFIIKKEKKKFYVGDILEFSLGVTFIHFLSKLIYIW